MPVSRFGRPLLILALSGLLALGQVPAADAAPAGTSAVGDEKWALSESGVEATGSGVVRPDWLSAATTARASGQRVEVLSERSETSRSWLLPNGQVLVEQFTSPVRFKESTLKSAGWRDIDMTLAVRADGTVGPKAAPTSVVLSGGGVGPMVSRTEASGVKASLDPAPGVKLGKPVLSGSKATYTDVAPGLDVVVDVAAGGFRWSWVAKTPAAAKKLLVGSGKSRAATARLKVTGGGKWAKDAAEAKISNGQGAKVARLGSPLVWDAQVNPTTKEPVNVVEAELVTADTAGGSAGVDADVSVSVDAAWLDDPARVYPITVDPTYAAVSTGPTFDTYVYSNYKNTDLSTDSRLRWGNDGGATVGYLRTYMNFDRTPFAGKKIMSAYLQLWNTASYACAANQWDVYDSDPASTASRWLSQPATGALRASSTQTKGSGCSVGAGYIVTDSLQAAVQAWADQSTQVRGLMVRARNESTPSGYKEVAASENASYPPRLVWTYDRAPAYPAVDNSFQVSPAQPFSGLWYLSSSSPSWSVVVGTDPDADLVQGQFEVWDAASGGNRVGTCSTGYASGGTRVSCSVSGLEDNRSYWVPAQSFDGSLGSGWFRRIEVRTAFTTPAAPVISCVAPYSAGSWSTSVAAASIPCTISAPGQSNSAPKSISYSIDGGTTQVVSITQSGDPTVARIGVSVPNTAGSHSIVASATSPSGLVSAVSSYKFGMGGASLIKPDPASTLTATDTVALEGAGPPVGASAAVTAVADWRVAGAASPDSCWVAASAPTAVLAAPVQVNGQTSATGTMDVSKLVGVADGCGVIVPDRRSTLVEVRLRFVYDGGTQATGGSRVLQVPHAFGRGFPTSQAGPGQVALWTGELSVADSDASVSAPNGSLAVARAHTSFAGPASVANGVFGPGWVAAFADGNGGLGAAMLTDSTLVDGSIVVEGAAGDALVFVNPALARRSGSTLPTGTYLPADETTAQAGIKLAVDAAGAVMLTSDDGTKTVFTVATAPTSSAAAAWRASEVSDTAVAGKTTYSYDAAGRVTAIVAPLPEGVTACVPGTASAGCRVLKISYATATTASATTSGDFAGQVKTITAQINTDPDRVLASYSYDTAGRMVTQTDARTGLVTGYGWAGTGTDSRLATITPPGQSAYTFEYTGNKLMRVTRPNPVGGTAQIAAFVYDVPLTGTIPALTNPADTVAKWAQKSTPTHLYATFGMDQPITGAPAAGAEAWKYAHLQLADDDGFTVNTASFAAGDWQYTAADYDTHENVVHSWDVRATRYLRDHPGSDPLPAATINTYNDTIVDGQGKTLTAAGTLLLQTLSPVREVSSGGQVKALRTRSTTSYDQGAPNGGINPGTGQPYRLPTKTLVEAVDTNNAVVETLATTFTGYDALVAGDKTGWELGQTTATTTDLDGDGAVSAGDITRKTRYDTLGRTVEQRQPLSSGSDAGTRSTVYYTAGTSPVTACGNKPEYSGWVCQVGPAGQPAGVTMPTTRTTSYTWDGQTATTQTTSGSVTSTTTTTFDSKDRPSTTQTVTSGLASSTPLPTTTTVYNDSTGTVASKSSTAGSQAWTYDTWGRTLTYTNIAAGNSDTTTTIYDTAGRVVKVVDPNGTTETSYAGTDATGNTEYRSVATTVTVYQGGGPQYVSTGAYDLAGSLIQENLPGQVIKRTSLDRVGALTGVTYNGQVIDQQTSQPTQDQPWFGWSTISNAKGQVVREWTPNGGAAYTRTTGAQAVPGSLSYTYDRAGRLTQVTDETGTLTGNQLTDTACQTRSYSFDKNGNRTSQTSVDGLTAGGCTTTGGSSIARSYDTADRPTTGANGQGAYTYDPLGRQLSIPAADAPLAALGDITLGYYDDDTIRTITQNGRTTTHTLDSAGRRTTQAITTTPGTESTLVRRYNDTSDNPTWTVDNRAGATTTTRYAELINGSLGLTLTTTTSGTTASLALASLRGDTSATVPITPGQAATGIDSFNQYTEYGQAKQTLNTNPGGTTGIGYGWLGTMQRATQDTGLTLMGARLYNQTTGLFTSLDPKYDGGDTNYGYPNDPINKTDLTGQDWLDFLDVVTDVLSWVPGPVGVAATIVGAGIAAYRGDYLGAGLRLLGPIGRAAKFVGGVAKVAKSNLVTKWAGAVSQRIGKNSVTIGSSASRTRYDLVGKAHYEKTVGAYIPTPHKVTKFPNPRAPKGWGGWGPVSPVGVRDMIRVTSHVIRGRV